MLKLDFSIVSTEERNAYVEKFFNENPDYKPSAHELETITNYILYGKDPLDKNGLPTENEEEWTNMSARKEIEIPTKYATWKRQQPSSLDEMIESPTFNESTILSNPIATRTPKPKIDRALESNIPSMQELWEIIDYYAERLNDKDLTNTQRYQMRHMLIDLRRQQFALRDIFKPCYTSSLTANKAIYRMEEIDSEFDWESPTSPMGFAPMGFYHKGDARFENPLALSNIKDEWGYNPHARLIVDYRNPDHIDKIICSYKEIQTYCEDHFMSSQKFILTTLNYYIKNTKLSETQLCILQCKIARFPNRVTAHVVNQKYGKTYNINYISTIYRKICASIGKTAERFYTYYLERINPHIFKRCSCCGKMKLRNAEEFTRKSRNSDGFSSKCKECENIGRKIK
jgi:hypothetical protein